MRAFKISLLLIFILLLAIKVNAEEIPFLELKNASQFSKLPTLITKADNKLSLMGHSADKFGYKRYLASDIIIFWGQKQILMNIDVVMNAYNAGKIELIGIKKYDRYGYIRDATFYAIIARMQELQAIENSYAVGTSTP